MLRKIRCFFAVVEAGSFTKAAQNMFLSQSAVSQQVSLLEQDLGTRLLLRESQGLKLTASGRYLYDHMKPLASSMEDVLARTATTDEDDGPLLVVRHHGMQDEALVIPFLESMRARHRKTKIRLERVTSASHSMMDVITGKADLLFGKEVERLPGTPVAFMPLCATYLACALPPGHKLARRAVLDLDDLLDEPLVLLEDHDGLSVTHSPRGRLRYQQIHNLVRARHRDDRLLTFASDASSALALARAGFGATLVDTLKAADAGRTAFVALRQNSFSEYGVFYRSDSKNQATAAALEELTAAFREPSVLLPGKKLVDRLAFQADHPFEAPEP